MRLHGFDYSRSYYYMVTIRCLKGLTPLSMIIDPGICQMTAITRAFVNGILGAFSRVHQAESEA